MEINQDKKRNDFLDAFENFVESCSNPKLPYTFTKRNRRYYTFFWHKSFRTREIKRVTINIR